MPKVQSDDVARELRYTWMGDPSFRLPAFEAQQWIAVIATLGATVGLLVLLRPGVGWGALIALAGLGAAYVAGWATSKVITPETGLDHVAFTVVAETLAVRDSGPVTTTTSLPAGLFTDAEEPDQ